MKYCANSWFSQGRTAILICTSTTEHCIHEYCSLLFPSLFSTSLLFSSLLLSILLFSSLLFPSSLYSFLSSLLISSLPFSSSLTPSRTERATRKEIMFSIVDLYNTKNISSRLFNISKERSFPAWLSLGLNEYYLRLQIISISNTHKYIFRIIDCVSNRHQWASMKMQLFINTHSVSLLSFNSCT